MSHPPNDTPLTDPSPASARRLRPGARAGRIALFGSGIVAALLAILIYRAAVPGPAPLSSRDVTDSIDRALASQTPAPALSEAAFAAIQPSVVLIQTDGGVPASGSPSPSGDPHGTLGTGVIIDDAGDILTSFHVVDDATSIKLTYFDGTTSTATILSSQPENDIAVLAAATLPDPLVPATLGNPGSARIGSEAFVVGNPFGLYASMSTGVISGLGRTFQAQGGGPVLHDLIQFDAAVNPGNSGGPLLDRSGRVIGIVAALINPTRQDVFVGIGLAVPIDVAGGAAGLPQY